MDIGFEFPVPDNPRYPILREFPSFELPLSPGTSPGVEFDTRCVQTYFFFRALRLLLIISSLLLLLWQLLFDSEQVFSENKYIILLIENCEVQVISSDIFRHKFYFVRKIEREFISCASVLLVFRQQQQRTGKCIVCFGSDNNNTPVIVFCLLRQQQQQHIGDTSTRARCGSK